MVGLFVYLGSAGGAWAAAASVTGSSAGVAAVGAGQRARLLAATLRQASSTVAEPFAAVHFTRQHLITCQPTGNVLQVTRDVAALLWRKQRNKFIARIKN